MEKWGQRKTKIKITPQFNRKTVLSFKWVYSIKLKFSMVPE